MKNTFIVLFIVNIVAISCQEPDPGRTTGEILNRDIDSLEKRIERIEATSKPRLSVLMNQLQMHHARMWDPGISGNWELLSYEFKKTRESLDDIRNFYGEKAHGSSKIGIELDQLETTLDSLNDAVSIQNKDNFVKSYQSLTFKCNNCHKEAGLDFYEIIKPLKPAYSGEMQ